MCFCSTLPDHKAQVGGIFWLGGAKIGGALDLYGINIGRDLNLSSVVVKERLRLDPRGDGLISKIGGKLDLSTGTVIGGVWLNQIEIHGDLKITDASIKGGLRAQQAAVSGRRISPALM